MRQDNILSLFFNSMYLVIRFFYDIIYPENF